MPLALRSVLHLNKRPQELPHEFFYKILFIHFKYGRIALFTQQIQHS
jgi:hypothetical protein